MSDFRAMMERYNQELLQMQQRVPTPTPDSPIPVPAQVSEFDPPIPAQPPVSEPAAPDMPPSAFSVESAPPAGAFTAPLQVRVTAASDAIPIPDALVVVTRREGDQTIVEATRLTDQSGLTEPIVLAAVDPALTLQPGNNIPKIVHEVSVSAPGYYRTRVSDIPLYGGIPTVLPVTMIPLPERTDEPQREIQYVTPPLNL